MPRFAFSTIATPELSLGHVADLADRLDYDAIDLYTEGARATRFACDPAMTSEAKIRRTLGAAGIAPGVLTTSIRFDAPVFPPVVGHVVADNEACVRQLHRSILLAQSIGAPLVRVLGFEAPSRNAVRSTMKRIAARLDIAATAARGSGVRVVLENGGSFATGRDLAELLARIESPDVYAGYSVAAAHAAGDDVSEGLHAVFDRLALVRLKDYDASGPVPLGEGEVPNERALSHLARQHWTGLITYDYDRAWFDGLANLEQTEHTLAKAVERMHHWYHGVLAAGRTR